MRRRPPEQEPIEVRPGDRIERTPLVDHGARIDVGTKARKMRRQGLEVALEKVVSIAMAFIFIETAAEKVGDVFDTHATPCVLKVDRRDTTSLGDVSCLRLAFNGTRVLKVDAGVGAE